MPRGGHMGLWKATPKDIFKSRWKRFYKRCYRPRTSGNAVDRAPPHEHGMNPNDPLASPWRLHYSLSNFMGGLPTDARRSGYNAYKDNVRRYMTPSYKCTSPEARNIVLRCLDRGQQGVCDSGLGRVETAKWKPASDTDRSASASSFEPPGHVPAHLFRIIDGEAERSSESKQFLELLQSPESQKAETFVVRRLYQLCEEWELVWEGGLNDPRRPRPQKQLPDGQEVKDRGRFPFVDEQASLIDELGLRDILRLAHRTKSRRHPKWREAAYWYKKCHSQYLRRKAILDEEVKQRMGALKASGGE
uniref:Uncharacterized protein n=1 Tax=Alexandrium catenella TaxID=2925 RepID=A0A7S1M8V0_ALECA|mmetsp:Transcript_2177/g.5870  ORF Transcript_2177/g.5870 Transcript_2177/m.5870 type:complete len:304 (+) Transcript_2177:100-1011(+)